MHVPDRDRTLNHLFGPVPSRRLGRSLGIDLVPFKTCSYDCIYCQVGRTTHKTVERKEFVPLDTVLEELRQRLAQKPPVDYITLSGSGEPTLYSELAPLIRAVKEMADIPVAVLTNGSLLWDREVQNDLHEADLVIPSLDAGDEETFQRVNRPHCCIAFDRMVEGIVAFRQKYKGAVWLEVFLLEGINATDSNVEKIAAIARKIEPDKIQLNTVARPPAEHFAFPVSKETMRRFAPMFGSAAEVIAEYRDIGDGKDASVSRAEVLTLLKRRPCTAEEVAAGLSIPVNEAIRHLEHLENEKSIRTVSRENKRYYCVS